MARTYQKRTPPTNQFRLQVEPSTVGAVNTKTIVVSYDPRRQEFIVWHKEVCGQPQRRCGAVAVNNTTTVTHSSCIRGRPQRRRYRHDRRSSIRVVVYLCYQNESGYRKHSDRSSILHLFVNSTTTRDS